MATSKKRSPTNTVPTYSLPWSVRRCIVAQNRSTPAGAFRDWARHAATRLSRVPPSVWELPIDWRAQALALDHAATVYAIERTPDEENRAHAAIARSLKRAAQLLNKKHGQLNPYLAGVFGGLALQSERLAPYLDPRRWPLQGADAPRLSEFLQELASWIAGEERRTYGMHRAAFAQPQRVGADGAALKAYERVSAFFRTHTGAPQDGRTRDVVMAYHPDSKDRDRARGRRARGKTPQS